MFRKVEVVVSCVISIFTACYAGCNIISFQFDQTCRESVTTNAYGRIINIEKGSSGGGAFPSGAI